MAKQEVKTQNPQKDIADQVMASLGRLEDEGLNIPEGYNPQNALKSAIFKINETRSSKKTGSKPALEHCTRKSIANSLLDMVIQGLHPAKNQCYFIIYGNELQLQRSYFGSQAVLKRLNSVKDIWANVIYDGDEFEFETPDGRMRLKHHKQTLESLDGEIRGAYAIIQTVDGDEIMTLMTIKEINQAWNQATFGQGDTHKNFAQEMAKKTVINRAAKNYINTSNDSDSLAEAINRTTENEYEDDKPRKDVTEEKGKAMLDLINDDEEETNKNNDEAQDLLNQAQEQKQMKQAEKVEGDANDNGEEGTQEELFEGATTNPK